MVSGELSGFKHNYLDALLTIHWKQWSTLGVHSSFEPEMSRIIDVEALFISTLSLGLFDKDLLTAAMEWMSVNDGWINLSRYKRIRKLFLGTAAGDDNPVLSTAVFDHMPNSMSRFAQIDLVRESKLEDMEYREFFQTFQIQGLAGEMNILQPSLVQLTLRGVFGIDARAEVLIYLLSHESGNSNSIARELFYDQKAVYRIIERWKASGVVETVPVGRTGNVSLKKEEAWMWLLGYAGKADYYNWIRFYLLSAVVLRALSGDGDRPDADLTISTFKSLYEDVRSVARPLNIDVPDPRFLRGDEYIQAFMSTMTRILRMLRGL